jgi:penicillin-binding protein 2
MAPKKSGAAGRLVLLYLVVAGVTVVLAARLYQLQIVDGERYRLMADENRLRLVEDSAPRGVIYAHGGEILARNRPSFTVAIVPADLPKDSQGQPDEAGEAAVVDRLLSLLPSPTPSAALRSASDQPFGANTDRPAPTATPTAQPTATVQAAASTAKSNQAGIQASGQPTSTLDSIPERGPWVMARADIEKQIANGRLGGAYRSIAVADHVPEETAFKIAQDVVNLPGVTLQLIPIRDYPQGRLTSDVLGYMGPIPEDELPDYENKGYGQNDQVGLVGLEYSLESQMHGKSGQQTIEVDVNGHKARTIGEPQAAVPGHNLVLTVDLNLQKVATEALQEALTRLSNDPTWVKKWGKVTEGAVVALDPRNGAVRAFVSLPGYDNNLFAKGITPQAWQALTSDKDFPLLNKALSGQFPPGSIFKQITAAAGLQEGRINVNTRLTDDGGIMYLPNRYFPWDRSQDQPFVCWSHAYGYGHGAITVRDALAVSCDIFFYKLGGGYLDFQGVGPDRLAEYAQSFGLGAPTGIDLPGEASGLIPTTKWKRLTFKATWVTGDTYNMSIGQGDVLVTPLQMANVTAAVANRGSLWQPQLVDHITDADGKTVVPFTPHLIRNVEVDPANLDIVREGMFGAINWSEGTAPGARVAGIAVAGKTGTAEFYTPGKDGQPLRDEKGNMPTHAWFTSFAPYGDPEIVVTVFIANGGEGSANAVPVAKKVLDAYFAAKSDG